MNTTDQPELTLDGSASIREQIEARVRACIAEGLLHPGEQLPTVRALAVALAVNPNAVEAAYATLERDGWLTTRDGSGVLVAPGGPAAEAAGRDRLETLCTDLLDRAAAEGFSPAEVFGTLRQLCLRRFTP